MWIKNMWIYISDVNQNQSFISKCIVFLMVNFFYRLALYHMFVITFKFVLAYFNTFFIDNNNNILLHWQQSQYSLILSYRWNQVISWNLCWKLFFLVFNLKVMMNSDNVCWKLFRNLFVWSISGNSILWI